MTNVISDNNLKANFQQDKCKIDLFMNEDLSGDRYFFRHTKQFNYLHDVILPSMMESRENLKKHEVSIWSAACGRGEEPYSIALTCRHFFKNQSAWHFKLYASDFNSSILKQARQGNYTNQSLRFVPDSFKNEYFCFNPEHKNYSLNEDVKNLVQFYQHDLLNKSPVENIKLVFIRDVMLYMDRQLKLKIFTRILDVLAPRGYIFIGVSELLLEFEPRIKLIYPGIYQKV